MARSPSKLKQKADAFWGVPFPADLEAFHALITERPQVLSALELTAVGPLEFLARKKKPEEARFYNDPPEMVTVLIGHTDGLHWGYWFDAPGELEPVIASYYANDAFDISAHGLTLFEAAREHLEAFHRDATNDVHDDPGSADDYRARLASYALVRGWLSKAWLPLAKRKETGDAYLDAYGEVTHDTRKPVASTRSKLGIVVPKKLYRKLEKKDPFEGWNYVPAPAEVKKLAAAATKAAADGFPGTALKLGHDLWIYREFRRESADLLDLAYQRLGRDTLRSQLKKAIVWRNRCDAEARS